MMYRVSKYLVNKIFDQDCLIAQLISVELNT